MAKGADGIPSYHSLYSLLVGLVYIMPSIENDQPRILDYIQASFNSFQAAEKINRCRSSFIMK